MYEKELQELLYSTGVFHSRKSYQTFVRTVVLAVREPWRLEHICRDIYLSVAMDSGQNVTAVEKAVQSVCRTIMDNGGTPFLKKLGGGIYWNAVDPYPKDIICIFACYLRKLGQDGYPAPASRANIDHNQEPSLPAGQGTTGNL